jgi:disulfide bond formation protein DsbB
MFLDKLEEYCQRWGLLAAWIIAIIGTVGSLFASNVLKLEPCSFCWYQRIFLFPLAIILGMAYFKKDKSIIYYVLPLIAIGGFIALYQSLTTIFTSIPACVKCKNYVEFSQMFGVSKFIPFLSFLGFLVMFIALACEKYLPILRKTSKKTK